MKRPEVLADMPSRLLLQMLGRNPPMLDGVTRELQSMLCRVSRSAAACRSI
jgi:hypothetical protein